MCVDSQLDVNIDIDLIVLSTKRVAGLEFCASFSLFYVQFMHVMDYWFHVAGKSSGLLTQINRLI